MSKTIKTLVMLCTAAFVLSACTSNSTSDTASTADSSSNASSNASNKGNVSPSEKKAVALGTVFYFDFDSSNLRAESRQLLNAHAAALKASPRSIRLEGHADERGTREYNIALGERRAQAVRAYLLAQGVNSAIEVISYGEERPAVDQSNEYAWQQNRRVVIK